MNTRELAREEIINTESFYLVQQQCEDCSDFTYCITEDNYGLVVFTEEAFSTLDKDQKFIYTKYPDIIKILDIATEINMDNIVFSTSKDLALGYSVAELIS